MIPSTPRKQVFYVNTCLRCVLTIFFLMSRFLDALHSGRVLLMDGAMGTELIRAGLPPGEPCETWNLTHPERVQAIHQAYVDAGAEVLLTNTFQANWPTLSGCDFVQSMSAIQKAAVGLTREVGAAKGFVLYDAGPMDEPEIPAEDWTLTIIWAWTLCLDGVDAFLLETFSDASVPLHRQTEIDAPAGSVWRNTG